MNLVHHFHWTSSVKCPNHHEAVNVFVDQPVAPGGSHIEITGCCREFTGLVEKKLRSVVRASFHTSVTTPSETGMADWLSKLPRRS
ncbi:MAG: hypothetical protein KF749_06580 [Bacteroidetes bacterium]|nr:hypothetical protein [Bacteroidota bacterium]MCW5896898.1 hypothetical protein [Bacteroidota bacterium]